VLNGRIPIPNFRLCGPGELVNVAFLIETSLKTRAVGCRTAVQQAPQGSYVYVIKPDGTVENAARQGSTARRARGWSSIRSSGHDRR